MRLHGDRDLSVYGIFGYPLKHTASPAIQNSAFDHHSLKSMYFAFERTPAEFRALMRNLKTFLLDGFNLTVPFKETVIPYLDRLSPDAKAIGAVNTVKKEGRRWIGYNTDGHGFLAGLREARFRPRGKSAVILGAGGSSRAVVFALATQGAKRMVIANRTRSRADRLVRRFRRLFPKVSFERVDLRGSAFRNAVGTVDLVVNATQVGLRNSRETLIPKRWLPKHRILVYDLIYKPRRTQLLQEARLAGHRVQNGETMLLHQGAKAFQLWTGRSAPLAKMKKALAGALQAK